MARNPLADPGILGINAGASLLIVIGLVLFDVSSTSTMVWFAFVGAAAATAVVYGVASLGRAGATPVKLALAGAAVSAALLSVVTAFLLTQQQAFDRFRFWQVGSLSGRSMEIVGQVWPFIAVGTVVALGCGRVLNGLALGDDVARGLGMNVTRGRLVTAAAVIVLCGAATAAAGPIAFVGLAVPHIARAIVGGDYRWVLPLSALIGPILLLFADVFGRLILPNGELQVGIVTAFFGAPVFILLVRRRKMAEL
jgi:iron complex transport system permease protein